MDAQTAIKALHATWCEITGQQLHPKATERLFFEFWRADFTVDDLRCALEFLLRYNRKSQGAQFRINAVKILGNIEDFAALLGEARASERNRRRPLTSKEKAVRELRPVVDPEQSSTRGSDTTMSLADVLKGIAKISP